MALRSLDLTARSLTLAALPLAAACGRGGLRRAGTHGVGPSTLATDLADFDGDRDVDLALVDEDADEVRLLRNRGNR